MNRIIPSVLAVTVLLVTEGVLFAGCSPNQTESVESVEIYVEAPLRVPTGDEIGLKIKILGPKKALVTVTNNSAEDVFVPYLPGIKSDRAFYAILGLEKQNRLTGDFERFEGGDFSPGLNALGPGEFYTYDIWVNDSGLYRVNIPILIDKRLRDRISNPALMDLPHDQWEIEMKAIDEQERESDSVNSVVTTTPFKL